MVSPATCAELPPIFLLALAIPFSCCSCCCLVAGLSLRRGKLSEYMRGLQEDTQEEQSRAARSSKQRCADAMRCDAMRCDALYLSFIRLSCSPYRPRGALLRADTPERPLPRHQRTAGIVTLPPNARSTNSAWDGLHTQLTLLDTNPWTCELVAERGESRAELRSKDVGDGGREGRPSSRGWHGPTSLRSSTIIPNSLD